MKYFKYLFVACLALMACGEKSDHEQGKAKTPRILAEIYVDPAFANITQELTDVYESINDSVDFKVVPLSEELSIQKFIKDSAVAIVVARALFPQELDQLDTIHQKVAKDYVFAQDAVAFVVNRSDMDSILTQSELLEIFTKNPKGKKIVFDANHSSALGYINKLLGSDSLHKASFATKNAEELMDFVSINKNVIGVIGSNLYSNASDSLLASLFAHVKLVGLKAEGKVFYPFQADIAAKKYPFARNLYIHNSEHYYGKYSGFKNFAIGPTGQRIILKSGLLPIDMPNRYLNFVKKRESKS